MNKLYSVLISYYSALAAQYCYFDHGISYEDWTGDKNDFSELFSELASPPEIVQFKNFGYFLTILRTDDEIIVTFPGTRKNILVVGMCTYCRV